MIKSIKITSLLLCAAGLLLGVSSCERLGPAGPNPFEENIINQDTVNFVFEDIDPNSIAGIYQNVFGPTCANSGCHDGTFEPDFRTIESSYHSMVYRIPVKNDGNLTYRVDPGNSGQSALMRRLDGTILPEMPIEIEPDSDWWEKSEDYIQNVKNWIDNGALDLAGNAPQFNYINPTLTGAGAMAEGLWLGRDNYYGPLIIPDSINEIEFFLAFDPINNPEAFNMNELNFGFELDEFVKDTSVVMEIMSSPMTHYGLYGKLIEYTHRVSIDLDAFELNDDQYYMRMHVQDGANPITEIPSNNGFNYFKEYMSFIRTH